MIISASRRTDIPTYYSRWFMKRLAEGFLYVRNPFNFHQVSEIPLNPDVLDGIVFWTKNPTPMLKEIPKLNEYGYMYYFQFTLNAYGKDVETNLADKERVILPTFKKLSEMIGKERVIWRYDPIFLSPKYSVDFHIKHFALLAEQLHSYTEKCVISFIDLYKKIEKNMAGLDMQPFPVESQNIIAKAFAEIAHKNGLIIETCSEAIDLDKYGIKHGHCIDGDLFSRLLHKSKKEKKVIKDKTQRPECGCIESIDIGTYNSCKNRCLYCYANFNDEMLRNNFEKHNPNSPLIIGEVTELDKIIPRKVESIFEPQLSLF